MRVSTLMMYQQNMGGITNSQSEWLKYGEQMSTGKRVNRASDDPVAASQAVVIRVVSAMSELDLLSGASCENGTKYTLRVFSSIPRFFAFAPSASLEDIDSTTGRLFLS